MGAAGAAPPAVVDEEEPSSLYATTFTVYSHEGVRSVNEMCISDSHKAADTYCVKLLERI